MEHMIKYIEFLSGFSPENLLPSFKSIPAIQKRIRASAKWNWVKGERGWEGGGYKKAQNGKNSHRTFPRCSTPIGAGASYSLGRDFDAIGCSIKIRHPPPHFGGRGVSRKKNAERRFLSLTHARTWLNELSDASSSFYDFERKSATPILQPPPHRIDNHIHPKDVRGRNMFQAFRSTHLSWRLYFIHA